MGGRGARSGAGGRSKGGGLSPGDIVSTRDLIGQRGVKQTEVDETLSVFKDVMDDYGYQIGDIRLATLRGKGRNVLAYYDGANIAVNESFFSKDKMDRAYEACVKAGFHPPSGNKSGMQAVIAHELGHGLTDAVAEKMGISGIGKINRASAAIVTQARKQTRHRGNIIFAEKISGYATHSNAECVAEAFADVYCNGKKARAESRAIVSVIKGYLK